MHRPEYINVINEAASNLGIRTNHFSENWAISLTKEAITKFIIGYTFPLNDSACYKIARNKNLCSEILSLNNISNVPHKLLFSPLILKKRNGLKGNSETIQRFINENGFPFLIKKNNSSRGDGVYLVKNEPELESVLSSVYTTDSTLCLSPFRENIKEYRNIVLNNECLLSYEKQIPFVKGNGENSILELLVDFRRNGDNDSVPSEIIFDKSLLKTLNEIPKPNQKIPLHWKHNSSFGINYELVVNEEMQKMAVRAAKSINAKFVSVDIIYSEKLGFEILEINASVVLNSFAAASSANHQKTVSVFEMALKELFHL